MRLTRSQTFVHAAEDSESVLGHYARLELADAPRPECILSGNPDTAGAQALDDESAEIVLGEGADQILLELTLSLCY